MSTRVAPQRPPPGIRAITGVIGSAQFSAVLACAAVAVFYTNADRYIGDTFGFIIPLYWLVGFLAAAAASLALHWRLMDTIPISPLVLWCYGYVTLSLMWYIPFSNQTTAAAQQLQSRFISALFLVIVTMILADPRTHLPTHLTIAWAVVFASIVNIYELLHPSTFSSDFGRSAGLYINPNQTAAAIVLGVICAQDVVSPRWRAWFLALSAVGVALTLSRAGIVAWILVFIISRLRAGPRGLLKLGVFVLLAAVVLVPFGAAGIEGLFADTGVLSDDVQNRVNFFESGSASDTSAESRVEHAGFAWDMFVENPAAGRGTGASVSPPFDVLGPHNIYLSLMVDHGVIGVLIVPLFVLAAALGTRGAARGLAVGVSMFILYWGMFSHNVLEERYLLLAVALIAAVTTSSQNRAGVQTGRLSEHSPRSPVTTYGEGDSPKVSPGAGGQRW